MTGKLPEVDASRPQETGDGSLTLGWEHSHVTYRSTYGAWTESNHVFVRGARVFDVARPAVFEFGLGAATNFFATLQALYDHPSVDHLDYHALESAPLSEDLFTTLVESYPVSANLREAGLRLLKSAIESGLGVTEHLPSGQTIELKVTVQSGLPALQPQHYTSIYFDPFGPRDNPDAWSRDVFSALSQTLTADGILSTYAAASEPRRAMAHAGLIVAREHGAGGKREMTIASKSEERLQGLTIWPKKLK